MDFGTMDVIIDGKTEKRPIDCFCRVTGRWEPKLNDGEECLWTVGSKTPIIIQVPHE